MPARADERRAIVEAAHALDVPVEALRKWLAAYRRDHGGVTHGRPRRELDARKVAAAVKGRSLREAAALLGIPHTTLAGHLNRLKNTDKGGK